MSVVLFATVVVDISLLRYEKRKLFKTTIIAANHAADYKMATNNILKLVATEDAAKSLSLEFSIFFPSHVITYQSDSIT